MMRAPALRFGALLAGSLLCGACVLPPPPRTPGGPVELERTIVLNGSPLTLHLLRPAPTAPVRPLLIFATGDGGWHRKDLDAFRHMERWGYPLVGFSAPDYLRHLRGTDDTTTPAALARDYGRMIDAASEALGLRRDAPVVLVGVSRGAGLEMVAAAQPALRPRVGGILAIALTREEEYVRRRRRQRRVMARPYDSLARLPQVPIALIQSTHDNYVPAAEARRRFGPDGPYRTFEPIASRNHSFSDARDVLYTDMRRSLTWIVQRLDAKVVQ